jgi:molecular chaperone DnaK
MNRAADALSAASHKLAEAMYSKTRQEQQPGASSDGASAANGGGSESGQAKEDVVDADFKEVK